VLLLLFADPAATGAGQNGATGRTSGLGGNSGLLLALGCIP
jgi:hypothetical protein